MSATQTKTLATTRLRSIDALRGAAALGVVLYHAVDQNANLAPQNIFKYPARLIQLASSYGYVGVFLFFVISGFCIHLQWAKARSAGEQPKIQFGAFWRRRLRRLYPPYLIAFAVYLFLTATTVGIDVTKFFIYDVVMHLLMLHNLDPKTCYSINGVFWTLAIEEQLYLAYFLLLFLRIRYGWTITLVLCFSARVGWLIMSRGVSELAGVHIPVTEAAATNWFIWALGALSVEAALGLIKLPAWCSRLSLAGLSLGCAVALAQLLPLTDQTSWLHDTGWLIMHPAWGVGFFVLVNYAVAAEQRWRVKSSPAPGLIPMLAGVGLISYSLYLTHSLVLMHWYWFGFTRLHILSISLLILTPLSVVFAWLFYRLCERPFMHSVATKRPAKPAPRVEEEIPLAHEVVREVA